MLFHVLCVIIESCMNAVNISEKVDLSARVLEQKGVIFEQKHNSWDLHSFFHKREGLEKESSVPNSAPIILSSPFVEMNIL